MDEKEFQKPLEPPTAIPQRAASGSAEPSTSKDIEELLKELPPAPKIASPPPSSSPSKPITSSQPNPNPAVKQAEPLPKPTKPEPLTSSSNFKSFVRTMGEDIEAAKKGLKPEPKPFEIKPPPGGPKIAPPPPPLKMPSPQPEVKLGPSEKTKPLELPKINQPAKGPVPIISPQIGKKSFLNVKLLILVLALIGVAGSAWYFLTRGPEEIAVSPTPTPTSLPTPKSLQELIFSSNQIAVPSTANFVNYFSSELKNKAGELNSQPGKFTYLNLADENGTPYSFSQIISKLNIALPAGFLESLSPNEWIISAYTQQEMFDSQGNLVFNQNPETKLAFIIKITDPTVLRSALNNWEITLSKDLEKFFELDSKKATSDTFLDNFYKGVNARYRNFPYADKTIDYAIIDLPQFNASYLILTNSRESIYSAIDLLKKQ
ncbi:MAG: hypothetical protein AAB469_00390 [Patescibacteria group bacterium]|mgnify:CR=1 FL=1